MARGVSPQDQASAGLSTFTTATATLSELLFHQQRLLSKLMSPRLRCGSCWLPLDRERSRPNLPLPRAGEREGEPGMSYVLIYRTCSISWGLPLPLPPL